MTRQASKILSLFKGAPAQRGVRVERLGRYYKGWAAEYLAAGVLIAKGYRIIARRARTPAGEIDTIALRGSRLAFVEVKYRQTMEAAAAAISPYQRRRVTKAAQAFVARHRRYRDHDIGMDAMLVCPWRRPRHEQNALQSW